MTTWDDLIQRITEQNALALLDEVKGVLRVAWADEDETIQKIILRGIVKLDDLAGIELDYIVQGESRSLLLQYCRYDYNNASEYFEENFQREILRLQLKTGVDQLPTDEEVV